MPKVRNLGFNIAGAFIIAAAGIGAGVTTYAIQEPEKTAQFGEKVRSFISKHVLLP